MVSASSKAVRVNGTAFAGFPAREKQRQVTKTYDLSAFSQPEVGQLREAAGMARVLGLAANNVFQTANAEVNLEAAEAKFEQILANAKRGLELVKKFQGK